MSLGEIHLSLCNYSVDELKSELFKREFGLAIQLELLLREWENESLNVEDAEYWILKKCVADLSDLLFKYKSLNPQPPRVSQLPTVEIPYETQELLNKETKELG
jgi:hypothetical protein